MYNFIKYTVLGFALGYFYIYYGAVSAGVFLVTLQVLSNMEDAHTANSINHKELLNAIKNSKSGE